MAVSQVDLTGKPDAAWFNDMRSLMVGIVNALAAMCEGDVVVGGRGFSFREMR